MLRRSRLALLVAVLAALGSIAGLSACGEDDEETVQTTLDEAFSNPIGSADVAMNLNLELEGSQEFTEPVRVQLTGPYRTPAEDQLPALDWDLSIAGAGATQIPPIGLISTGDNFFVEVQGTAYEAGEDVVSQAVAQQPEQDEQGLAAFGIDPREWIVDGQDEGEEEVAGVTATHVSGAIDVPALLTDLNEVAQNTESPVAGQMTPALTEEQIAQVEEVIGDPTFDVFVGEDGILRRMTVNVAFTVPEAQRAAAGGLTGGTIDFSIEFANVGGDQEITAPADARPLEELVQQLSGAFGGALPGGSGSQLPGLEAPGAGSGQAPPSGGGQVPGGGGQVPGGGGQVPGGGGQVPGGGGAQAPTSPEAEQFQKYGDCLQKADPSDPAALEQCNELLVPSG